MTRIGGKNPGDVAADFFEKATQRVNPSEATLQAEEFHAAQESVKKRDAAESDAAGKIQKPDQNKALDSRYGIDPAVRAEILRQTGRDVDPDPKP